MKKLKVVVEGVVIGTRQTDREYKFAVIARGRKRVYTGRMIMDERGFSYPESRPATSNEIESSKWEVISYHLNHNLAVSSSQRYANYVYVEVVGVTR